VQVILVDDEAIEHAVQDVFLDTRAVLEPAGAISVAGLKAYCAARPAEGGTYVAVGSDASNVEFDFIQKLAGKMQRGS
jgi:threonine dehydratase